MQKSTKYLIILLLIGIVSSCSTEKNTLMSRSYHNLTAYYNVYFNARESFKSGVSRLESGYTDDYSKRLEVFKFGDEPSSKTIYPDMDKAIKKCSKMIKMHSITKKPKRKKGRLSKSQRDFYAKNEYNSFVDNAYLLMGKAYFYKLDLLQAQQNFDFVIKEFEEGDLKYESYIWKARAFILADDFTKAREVLDFIENDRKLPKDLKDDLYITYAEYYLQQNKSAEAVPFITKALEFSKKKKDKIRYTFILAQIYQEQQEYPMASEMYTKVLKYNPPYEMAFNAKIRKASSFSVRYGGADELMKELGKMLNDDKNLEYKDQIYFAMAEIEFKRDNVEKALEYYKESALSSITNTNQRAASYLAMADIYYKRTDYKNAQMYYDSTVFFIDPEVPNYKEIESKSRNLTDLVTNLDIINREDSLQKLAKLSEKDLNKVIDEIIAGIIEEERKAKEAEQMAMTNAAMAKFQQNDPRNRNLAAGGKWYFYNPTALSFGQTEFVRLWGRRKLEDNWRRKNKEMVLFESEADTALAEEGDTLKVKRPTDNKSREFYLVDIPFTDSLVQLSNAKIVNAYFNAGEIYRDRLLNENKSIETFEELLEKYPGNDYALFTYYNLYKMFTDASKEVRANEYKTLIINNYPESKYAQMFTNPNYLQELASKSERAKSLYQLSYYSYNSGKYKNVIDNVSTALNEYPDSELIPKFLFLRALAYGELQQIENLALELKSIIKEYPKSDVYESALAIATRLNKEGSLKEKLGDIVAEEEPVKEEVPEVEIYSPNPKGEHFYICAVPNKKTDMNRLKYQYSNFNLDYFSMEQFKVSSVILNDDIQILTIKTFTSAKKAEDYYKTVIANLSYFDALESVTYQHFIISSDNFAVFFKDKRIAQYLKFQEKNYNLQ